MRCVIAGLVLLFVPFAAAAQPAGSTLPSTAEPTTVSVVTGVSVGSDEVGALAGGTLSAGIKPWLSLEGSAGFADRGPGVSGIYALVSAVFNVLPASSRVVPFASIGGGIYHADFDMGNRDLFAQLGEPFDSMSMEFGEAYSTWLRMFITGATGMTADVFVQMPRPRQIPRFYADRMASRMTSNTGPWRRQSFTDPATSLGGGAVIRLSDKVVLRPDARAIVVFNEGDANVVGLFNLGVGFRF